MKEQGETESFITAAPNGRALPRAPTYFPVILQLDDI
jgi:hypothetical protein